MRKVIIGIELSLSRSRQLPGGRKSRNAKSDNWNRIITFVLPASGSFQELIFFVLPAASRELPGRAGMLKVMVGIELVLS